ncbi:MAG: Zn-ribbon domain-containing OB-fold protein [Acidilobaceae archaeon]
MSVPKKFRLEDTIHVKGKIEVEKYVYTPGVAGLKLAEALIDGRMLGIRCGDKILVPAKLYCPDFTQGEIVEVKDPWIVEAYTVIYEDIYGRRLEKPQIIALVRPENSLGGIIHYVKTDIEKIRLGLRVKPVFKPREERRGLITDIEYFEQLE